MKRTQAKREVFQAQQRSMLSVVNPYLPKGLHGNGPKQPLTAPIEKTLDKRKGKTKIMIPSNTLLPVTDVDVLASKTQGPETNLSVSAGSEAEPPLNIVQSPYYFNPVHTKIINSQLTNLIQ